MEVTISWDKVDDIDGYNVYRAFDPIDIGVKINGSLIVPSGNPEEVYVDDVAPAVYFYRVTSSAGGVESLPSDAIRIDVGSSQDLTPRRAKLITVQKRGN